MPPFASAHTPRKPLAALAGRPVTGPPPPSPALPAEETEVPKGAPKGATVTVLKAAKFCFPAIVEASGIIIPREENMVRPDRPGLKGAEIPAEPGDPVT